MLRCFLNPRLLELSERVVFSFLFFSERAQRRRNANTLPAFAATEETQTLPRKGAMRLALSRHPVNAPWACCCRPLLPSLNVLSCRGRCYLSQRRPVGCRGRVTRRIGLPSCAAAAGSGTHRFLIHVIRHHGACFAVLPYCVADAAALLSHRLLRWFDVPGSCPVGHLPNHPNTQKGA